MDDVDDVDLTVMTLLWGKQDEEWGCETEIAIKLARNRQEALFAYSYDGNLEMRSLANCVDAMIIIIVWL